jgi:hypothetical protein
MNVLFVFFSSWWFTPSHSLLIQFSITSVSKYTKVLIRHLQNSLLHPKYGCNVSPSPTYPSQPLSVQILRLRRSRKPKVPLFFHFESLTYTHVDFLDLKNLLQSLWAVDSGLRIEVCYINADLPREICGPFLRLSRLVSQHTRLL